MNITARAKVTLEINGESNWSEDTSISQIRKQAIEDAIIELQSFVQRSNKRIKMIGSPEIRIVTMDDI